MNTPLKQIAICGLAVGGVFGMAGTFVPDATIRTACWGFDAVGLIVATALLAVRFLRLGNDIVAAGFLVFAIGESIILSGTAATLEASVPSFGAGVGLWSAGLCLTSIPKQFPRAVRLTGMIAAVLFAITAARIFLREMVLPISSPLPFFAYPFLVLTFAGWIWSLWKSPENNS